MSTDISGVTNKDDVGHYSWEKTISDVNDIDESFLSARDLGYTRLNYARVTTIASLDKYDSKDLFTIQLQSNGNLTVSLRRGSDTDEKVLDLSKYDQKLEEFKRALDPEGYAKEHLERLQTQEKIDIFETAAPGMYLKVYTVQRGRQVLIADSTADKDSELYKNAEAVMSGDYKAKKGSYYIEVGRTEGVEIPKEGMPYALQIMQGKTFKHDYITTETPSYDSRNKKITNTPDAETSSANNPYGVSTISAAYAAQIQAQSYSGAATMLSNGYLNVASMISESSENKTLRIFSTLIDA